MIEIKQHSLMRGTFGLLGAVMIAAPNGVSRAWWAGDEQYSILEFPYGLSIKVRKPTPAAQIQTDVEDIIKQLMPDGFLKIETDGDIIRVFNLTKEKKQ